MDDDTLVARSLTDPHVFEELVGRHGARIHGFLRRRAPEAADDLLSEAWLHAFAGHLRRQPGRGGGVALRDRPERPADPSAVTSSARLADPRRPARRTRRRPPRRAVGGSRSTSRRRRRRPRVAHRAGRAARRRTRSAAPGRLGTALPTEAAAALGIPAGTARSRLHRARTRISAAWTAPGTTSISTSQPTEALRLRTRWAVGAAGLVAASLLVGRVVISTDDGPSLVQQQASASQVVLERAASAALAEPDLVVEPGQFLKLTLVEQGWISSFGGHRQERRTREFFVPYDVDADWTTRISTELVTPGSMDPDDVPAFDPSDNRTFTQRSLAREGRGHLATYDPDWYATLPTEPGALKAAIKAEFGGEGSGVAYDFQETYSEVLRSGLAPAAVRAALFDALADSPGMVVEEGVATLDGDVGVALGAADSTWRMVFDADSGAYLGERATSPDFPDVDGLDADRTTWLTQVSREVVDAAPPVS